MSSLHASVVRWLRQQQAAAPDAASFGAAVDVIAQALAADESSALDLEDIFAAGCEARGNTRAALEASPKFQQFKQKVEEKGFFGGAEPGSASYNEKYEKLVGKFIEKFGMPGAAAPAGAAASASSSSSSSAAANAGSEDADAIADRHKEEGNRLLGEQKFEDAVAAYTRAIDASPTGASAHIYYANRAAARMHLSQYEESLEDCTVSLTLKPDYGKAHARSAAASLRLGRDEDARKAARRALELEPGNASAKQTLDSIGRGGAVGNSSSGSSNNNAAGGGGMPDLSALMGALGGGGGGGGGMPGGLGGLLGNPAMMQMAQQMMSDPQMREMAQNMMSDPQAMQRMMGIMGGMGGAQQQQDNNDDDDI